MKPSVAELYDAHPFDHDKRWWCYPGTPEQAAAAAGELHLQQDGLTYLEALSKTDRDRAQMIRHSLIGLPPEAVIDAYGDSVAAWAVANTIFQGEDDGLKKALAEKAGYDIHDLEIAMNWNWQHRRGERSATDILAQYTMMQTVKNGALASIDLPAVLTESTKDGVDISAKRLGHYALEPIETDDYNIYYSGGRVKGWSGDITPTLAYGMWLDSPVGYTLTYKGLPNAMVGLAMTGSDELMMYQLQGVQAQRIDPTKSRFSDDRVLGPVSSRGLAPLDWQKTLVTVNEQLGTQLASAAVGIQSAKNNVWTVKRMPRDTEPHLPMDKAIQTYDATAERLGYAHREETDNNWHKQIA